MLSISIKRRFQAIKEGEELSSISQKEEFENEIKSIFSQSEVSSPYKLLASLIASGIVEIKLAIGKYDPNRLFHDKVGIFSDGINQVAFRGSINETFKGLSNDGNFESLDAFTSWDFGKDQERVANIEKDFETIWENVNENIETFEIPDTVQTLIEKHAIEKSKWHEVLDEIKVTINQKDNWSADKGRNGRKPREHQINALKAWDKNGRRGIFEHATGSGKTFTALCAIRKELEQNNPVLILVPSVGLLNQWNKELSETLSDLNIQFLLCGDGNILWREGTILRSFSRPSSRDRHLVILSTMGTAASDEFLNKIFQSDRLMVVADEVHRMGSEGNRNFFKIKCGSRLGLSATPERYNDSIGTQAILNFFGGIIPPPYTLKDAIDDGVLCKYFYFPQVVKLTETEQESWNELSERISIEYARMISSKSHEDIINSNKLKSLILRRSRILKSASNKILLAKKIIQEKYKPGQRWIIYCDDSVQLRMVLETVKSIANIRVFEYHSRLSKDVKEATLKYFTNLGGVIVSIRCLDEGIDIPATSHALILASSQNPREFIQRRGRILRKYQGKYFAYLYDAIVIPNDFGRTDKHSRIVETELVRAIQFGTWSQDKSCINHLRVIAIDNDIDYSNIQKTGIEHE